MLPYCSQPSEAIDPSGIVFLVLGFQLEQKVRITAESPLSLSDSWRECVVFGPGVTAASQPFFNNCPHLLALFKLLPLVLLLFYITDTLAYNQVGADTGRRWHLFSVSSGIKQVVQGLISTQLPNMSIKNSRHPTQQTRDSKFMSELLLRAF